MIYAEAPDLDTPFTRISQIEGVFSHEPSIAQTPNGSWVMYFAQYMDPATTKQYPPCNCSSGTGTDKDCSTEVSKHHPTYMVTSPKLSGPWSKPSMVPLLDCNKTYCQHDMTLAGKILPNGTFVGMVKVHGKHGSEAHLVVADDWSDSNGYVRCAMQCFLASHVLKQ